MTDREAELKAENKWLTSSLISLLALAEDKGLQLSNERVAAICRLALGKREGN